MTIIGEHVSPTLETGVEGIDLLLFVTLERFRPPLADTGVRKGLLEISLYPVLAVNSLDSTSLF